MYDKSQMSLQSMTFILNVIYDCVISSVTVYCLQQMNVKINKACKTANNTFEKYMFYSEVLLCTFVYLSND